MQQQMVQMQEQAQVPRTVTGNVATFALAPALVNTTSHIDYSTKEGSYLFNAATKELANKFDIESPNITTFKSLLVDRATASGWNTGAGNIVTFDIQGESRNLIDYYGIIPTEAIKAQVEAYAGTQTRQAQNSFQMYMCVMNSITEATITRSAVLQDRYMVEGIPSGPLFYKTIMEMATLDTRVTVAHVRENLANLDAYIISIDSDIDKFNQYVKEQLNILKNRGETTQDLMVNLFKAYEKADDQRFQDYIARKRDQYDEGANLTETGLMDEALKKFKTLVIDKKWKALTADQEQIVALSAEVKQLKEKKLVFDKRPKAKNKANNTNTNNNNKGNNNNNSSGSNKKKQKKRAREETAKWAWKLVKPEDGKPKSKSVNGKQYHWCDKCEKWTLHTPEEHKDNKAEEAELENQVVESTISNE